MKDDIAVDGLVSDMNALLVGALGALTEQQGMVDDYRSAYYNYGDAGYEEGGRQHMGAVSCALVRDVQRTVEGSMPSLVQPFIEKDIAVLESDNDDEMVQELVQEHQDLINKQWNKKSNPLETIETLARNMQVDGTVWTKVGWNDRGFPTVDIVPFESVLPDPSAYKGDDIRFVIHRRKVTISHILSTPMWFGEHALEGLNPLMPSNNTAYEAQDRTGRDDNFSTGQRASDQIEIFEFYGEYDLTGNGITEPVVVIWSEDMLLSAFPSPFNGFTIPFDCGVYVKQPYSIYGMGVGGLIGEHQRTRQEILRGIIDNMNTANNGTKYIKKGAFDQINMKRHEQHARVVEVNHNSQEPLGNAFWDGGFNQIPPEVYKLMESYEVEQENLTGITKYAVGSDSRSLNQTATGVSIISSMSQRRLVFVTQHISGLLSRVFKKWIAMNDEFIIGSGLASEIDLFVRAGTAGLQSKKVQDISNMLSALAPHAGTIDPAIITDLVADMAENMDLDVTARKIRDSASKKNMSEEDMMAEQNQQQEEAMVKQMAMRGEAAEIAKDEAKATLDHAKAQESQVNAANKMYGN